MKAVLYDRYGSPEVLQVKEVARPSPADDEVLVRVHASTVNRTDVGLRSAELFISRLVTGIRRPKLEYQGVGMEFSGEVEAAGGQVKEFAAGDRVFGIRQGANAEFLCVRESGVIAHLPDGMTFEQGAAVPDGALAAMVAMRTAALRPGQRVLVYGASGSIGTGAVQVAKSLGAHVTAVCNTRNVELVRSLGADEVIDFEREDFTRDGQTYDVIFDAVGKHSFRRSRRSLAPGGVFLDTDLGFMWHVPLFALGTRWVGDRKVKMVIVRYSKEDLLRLKELVERGEYRPVIDRSYPLEDVVEASRYVETGQKTGNVVLIMGG